MSSLNNNFINKTFNSLLKLFNNESFTGTTTHTISDGLGNTLPVSFSPNTTEFTGTVCADTIVGGTNNNSSGTDSGILGGTDNRTLSNCSSILGGDSNTTLREYSTILGGSCNITNEAYSIIGGGCNNTTEGAYSAILGGQNNYTNADNTFIIGSNITATTENTLYVENISIKGDILDFDSNGGTTGQVLTKGSDGLEWTNINTIITGNNVSVETFVVYTSNTNTLIGTKLNISDFRVYSSNTNTLIGTKIDNTNFFSYTAATDNKKLDKTTFWDYTASTANSSGNLGTAFTQSFYSYTAETKSQIDSKVDYSTFTGYTATTNTRINNKVETSTYNTFVSNTNGCLATLNGQINTINSCIVFIPGCDPTSTVRCGSNNNVTATYSSVLGGSNNQSTSPYSIVVGGDNNSNDGSADCSFIGNGFTNRITERFSSIINGDSNIISGAYSFIGGGNNNNISTGLKSSIVGGEGNTTNSNYNFIGGGNNNNISVNADCSVIGGGHCNTIVDAGSGVCLSTIGGGTYNVGGGNFSFIGGGFQNTTYCESSFVGGGCGNINTGLFSVIVGGQNNNTSGTYSFIGGGLGNIVSGGYSAVLGGNCNNSICDNTFILGSCITTSTPNTTYVESLNICSALYDNNGSCGSSTSDILTSTIGGLTWRGLDSILTGSTAFGTKLSLTDFYTYTSNTNNLIGTKLNISDFRVYSSNTNTLIGTKLNITDFSSYSSNTNTLIGTKYDKAGGIISGDVTITGSLTLLGTGNTINVQNSVISSPILLLASGSTLATLNAGLLINRATTGSTAFIYKENLGEYQLGYTTATTASGLSEVNFDSYGKLRLGGLYTTNIYDRLNNSGSVDDVLFSKSNGVEWGNLNYKLNVSDFNSFLTNLYSYTSNTNNLIGTKLDTSTFNSFTNSFYSYSSNTNNLINTKFDKSGGTITGGVNVVGNVTGNTFYGIGGYTSLGTPIDGSYDTGLLGLTSASTINYAVDQIDTILALLAPAKPPRLDTSTWISPGYSSAVASGDWVNISGTTISKVIFNNLLPQFRVTGGTSGTFSGFWNGLLGNITFNVNGVSDGNRTLTTTSVNASTANTGTYLGLTLNVNDYYLNQTGKSGFWSAISASGRTQNSLSNNVFTSQTYTLTHSNTGSASEVFYVDNTYTPTISNISQTSTPSITRYVSGVPSLAVGDSFTYSYRVNNGVSKFYTTGTFGKIDGSTWTTNSTSYPSSSLSPKPFSGQSVTLTSQSLTATTNKYSESPSITFYGYNAINGVGTSSSSLTGYRIDTVSNENRLRNAANGENPTFFPVTYTSQYTSSERIVGNVSNTSYNYELQLLNGSYQVPSGNYTSYGGYDYSSPGSDTRFVLLTGSPLSSVNSVTITFNGISGTWSAAANGVTSGLNLNVRVSGIGWIDGNAAYPGSGSPSSNGDPAMVASPASTATSKLITFGTVARSGTIYVRIGLPAGSDKKFTGITIS
jgi:hypothetical protein